MAIIVCVSSAKVHYNIKFWLSAFECACNNTTQTLCFVARLLTIIFVPIWSFIQMLKSILLLIALTEFGPNSVRCVPLHIWCWICIYPGLSVSAFCHQENDIPDPLIYSISFFVHPQLWNEVSFFFFTKSSNAIFLLHLSYPLFGLILINIILNFFFIFFFSFSIRALRNPLEPIHKVEWTYTIFFPKYFIRRKNKTTRKIDILAKFVR